MPSDAEPTALARTIGEKLRLRGETVALAESVTGGLATSYLTDVPGASAYVDRAWVLYQDRSKHAELGVDRAVLDDPGPISEPVARQMASGAVGEAATTWGVATTGLAGPGEGTQALPVGTIIIAVAGPDVTTVERYKFEGDRRAVKAAGALQALADLLDQIPT